ncbi:MAG: transcriptional repressor [Synergistales bacterium]|nr:transcriptional repressor [Synergistales bacterium]
METAILKRFGLRPTEAREAVLRVLYRAGRPLTNPQIRACPGMEEMDKVTLYRTLYALEEAGLVHQVQGMDGAWHFCAHRPSQKGCPGDHPHFLCTGCGRMECLTSQSLPYVEVPRGARVRGKQLVVYGLCRECAKIEDEGA